MSTVKLEEKPCNNPLAGLANTINSITNGVSNDESTTISVSVPVTVNSKHVPPKAMVKPQVLTHVIEGFVIQEGTKTKHSILMYRYIYYLYVYKYIYFSV